MGTPRRFVLLSMPRTGSTMVTESLSAIAGVHCLPAIFSKADWHLIGDLRGKLDPAWEDHALRVKRPYALLREIISVVDDGDLTYLGWKHHLVLDPEITRLMIKNAAIKKIILTRENLLASYSSDLVVKITGQGHAKIGDDLIPAKCRFSSDEFRTYCFRRNKVYARWADIETESRAATMRVDYTDLIGETGLQPILDFLGLRSDRADIKTLKRNSSDIISRFDNGDDAVEFLKTVGKESWATEEAQDA